MANYYIFTAGTVPVNFSITAQLLDGTTETATLNGNVVDINVASIRVFTSMYNNQPAGQDDFDSSTTNEGTYVFDELGLLSYATDPADSKLLTHVIFHPVQKSANRTIEIIYTVRVQLN